LLRSLCIIPVAMQPRALAVFSWASVASATQTDPLAKVLQLIDDLTAKVNSDAETADKVYHEFFEWCDDASTNAQFEIKTAVKQQGKLEAKIGELDSVASVSGTKIEELAASISKAEKELKGATATRKKEEKDFAADEKELMDVVDTLARAVGVLEKEMNAGASLAQLDHSSLPALLQSMGAIVDAAGFASNDKAKLLALVQNQDASDDDDEDTGAPAPDAYKSKSGGIVDTIEDMKDKAEAQLSDARKAEMKTKHNYEMLKQGLDDTIAADKKDLAEQKSNLAAAQEDKGTAEGELEVCKKDLKTAQDALATSQSDCMTSAADHEATIVARKEELEVIAKSKKILEETAGGAAEKSYSFLQVSASSRMEVRVSTTRKQVVRLVKQLAKEHHSAALAQLASRIAATMKYSGSAKDDVFGKVKGMIQDMIGKLEKEASEEADEKAFCDEELAKTEAKKGELDDDLADLNTRIEQASAKTAELKEETKELQSELAVLAKTQAEMDAIRNEESTQYLATKKDLEAGLDGVGKALDVLRDYYESKEDDGDAAALIQDTQGDIMAQPAPPEKFKKSGGAGSGIIGILEVVQSDFAKNLATVETEESDAGQQYEQVTKENKLIKQQKDNDVKYKTKEFKGLDKTLTDLASDKDTVTTELDAVNQYFGNLKDRCIAKPEPYEERKARRDAEIKGLKQASEILESETAFTQSGNRGLRVRQAA